MAQHSFHLKANWTGGRLGNGSIEIGNLNSTISVPTELGGPGVGTNPEDMLIGAASTCYLITLASVLANRKLNIFSLSLTSEGIVSEEGGLHFERITHRPTIVLQKGATDQEIDTAQKAAERAEHACMISKALRGNVEVSVEASVTVEEV
ncbi:OsmC family protein [Ammoniphilus resinae]|uniref:Peroxiredoxin-like protein n=1 Tax=Ammoniphilus resinae TaxID=861532 RepID=A0ABS4GN25_9BACL|nr:OsmC family protein [Ammoniphilus resinae]MBP1931669.1 peroxiredoxin-like protein [Ammoniphilus resinae]